MGEKKRRLALAGTQRPDIKAIEQVSRALRKLVVAASPQVGRDCYLHAAIGQQLLADLGIQTKLVAGYAAWRVGEEDGSVIAHVPGQASNLPPGMNGYAYHAWLDAGLSVIDFSTHTLRHKAQILDESDGGHTDVLWCPDFLVLDFSKISEYRQVAEGGAELAFYEPNVAATQALASTFSLDPADLQMARFIISQPDVIVVGPNQR